MLQLLPDACLPRPVQSCTRVDAAGNNEPWRRGEIKSSELVRDVVLVGVVAFVAQVVVVTLAAFPPRAQERLGKAHVARRSLLVTCSTRLQSSFTPEPN